MTITNRYRITDD